MAANLPDSVILRDACLEDAPILLAWELQPELQSVTTMESEITLDFICRHILSSMSLQEDRQKRFIIEADGVLVGTADLYDYDGDSASVGVFVDGEFRCRGYATQGIELLIAFARKVGVNRLNAEVSVDNRSSLALFHKVGFVSEGEKSQAPILQLSLNL